MVGGVLGGPGPAWAVVRTVGYDWPGQPPRDGARTPIAPTQTMRERINRTTIVMRVASVMARAGQTLGYRTAVARKAP